MARKPKIYKTIGIPVTQEMFDDFVITMNESLADYGIEYTKEELSSNPKVIKAFETSVIEYTLEKLSVDHLAPVITYDLFRKEITKASDLELKLAEAEAERIAKEGAVIRVQPENQEMAEAILRAAGLLI